MPDWDKTKHYHQNSKHDHYRSAPSPGYMDWENQPDPFRSYDGAEIIKLKKISLNEGPLFHEALQPNKIPSLPLNFASLSQLLFDSLAISAWKSFQGSKWALRVNPSSGNLHPTEGYLICGPLEGINSLPSVSHYDPKSHALEIRTTFSNQTWNQMSEGENIFFIGLSSIYWREAWKYGLRAFRYCHHDMGHALAAINVACSALGWRTQLLDHLGSEDLETVLGFNIKNDEEVEIPNCLIAVTPQEGTQNIKNRDFVAGFSDLEWLGKPNILSSDHMDWDGITVVSQATQKPPTEAFPNADFKRGTHLLQENSFPIRKAIHQRRSAVAMDGKTRISRETFYQFMAVTIPEVCPLPFQTFPWDPQIHLGIFVHRVDDLPNGLYFLVRNKNHSGDLKSKLKKDFAWTKPEACPENLDLFLLQEGDFRGIATSVSCGQDIAGKGCFSLGMISAFEKASLDYGPWMYPRLYWECGAIGQMLYLQAEVSGIRSTGIGCFFDDPVRGVFGINDLSYQSLYHFTVGGPVEDTRLTTLPAYEDD
ncbi:MAG: SagB/ThcOx family dehydrogenase [Nitrospina sp.]|jgi:SagB-type dehydrogenase family enzyme|nr:SagB/ThcOx family dehydrogenase [Nitrospina sp.]